MMQEEYDELKQLFDDRPSKEEDLRLIQKLQQMLEQREEELRKAWQELKFFKLELINSCLLYTSPSPRDQRGSRMPSSA